MVDKIPPMVDMSATAEEAEEILQPSPPKYPYGLCISFCQDELEKLGLDEEELCIGDLLHLHALAKVTSVSSYDSENGSSKRVELVLAYIAAEDEDKEDDEAEKPMKDITKRLYR